MTCDTPMPAWIEKAVLAIVLAAVLLCCLAGCAGRDKLPPAPPAAVQVLVPVTKPCEVHKVEPSTLATAQGVADDIYEAVKALLVDRELLLADREKLVAANTDPCPPVYHR